MNLIPTVLTAAGEMNGAGMWSTLIIYVVFFGFYQ